MVQGLSDWLAGLDAGFFLLLWGGSIVLILLFLFLGFRYFIRARIVAHTPTSKLRSAAQGFNEIEGSGRPVNSAPLKSPLTFTPCLWYDVVVERQEGSGKNRRWVTVNRNRSDALFLVEDDTGEAYVDPDHARIVEHRKNRWRERGARSWQAGVVGGGNDDYRYTERLIVPGFPLYVLGWLETRGHRNDGISLNEAVERRREQLIREWQADHRQRQRFDIDGDGEISQREWDWALRLARAQARKEVREADGEGRGRANVAHLIRRPDNGDPYIISGIDQETLVRRKYRRAALLIGGAVLLFVFWYIAQTTRSPF
ncbi:MAG: GIDE domain-containing protein [Pseudomonadota bacterium]